MTFPVHSRFNLSESGPSDAPTTLVFVNGLGTDQSVWRQITPAFLDRYRLVCFDHVGSVPSNQEAFLAHQSHYLNVSGYASDLIEIVDTLKLAPDTVLIGHSLGAMAALLASIQRPKRIGRLVLLGASPRYANADDYVGGFSEADIGGAYKQLKDDYRSWTTAITTAAMGNPERPQLAMAFAETMARVPRDLMLTVLCSVLQTDHRADLAKVTAPTLLIQSRDDIFVPPQVAHYLHAHIPSSRLALIDATGHLPHVSAPETVIEAIQNFLNAS